MKIFISIKLKRIILPVLITLVISTCPVRLYSLNKERNKILLIGLDGAGWRVILPLAEEGKLPNIKKLMDSGCWGNLKILMPPTSEIVWTSIATGKPSHLHGITDSLLKDPDTNEMIPPTSNFRKIKAIWNILSEHRKKVGVVGYRVSWPAEKVNGVIISERASDSSYRSSFRYSEPLFVDLCTEEIFNSFKIGINNPVVLGDKKWVFIQDTFMSNVAKFLLKNKEFDFFCLYLRGIDVLSHYYWKYMFPEGEGISAEDISRYKDVIKDYYVWCDNVIGDLLGSIDKNTTLIIVSDHGFRTKASRDYIFSEVDHLLGVSGLKKINYNSKTITFENTPSNMWEDKKNIRVIGELSKEEFNVVRENAKNIIKNIKIKETSQPIFKISNDTDNGFVLEVNREHVNKVPKHHVLINNREYKISDFLIRDPDSGTHDATDAIIIISGKHISQHRYLKGASVYDITPTMLYLLDLPVAKDMQGNVLTSAIDLKVLKKRPVRYIDTYETEKTEGAPKPIRSPEEERIIKERMRSLGYIN